MRLLLLLAWTLSSVVVALPEAQAHCQVPCGIYDDEARFDAMIEDAATIAKAATKIGELSEKSDAQSAQQLVRWTLTKEEHASRIIEVVSQYFLTQKLKPVDAQDKKTRTAYLDTLAACHGVMRAAMVAKQKADPAAAEALSSAIEAMKKHFPHAH